MSVPLADGLRHDVASIVDDVGVVAGAADERVGARAAVQRVIADAAGDGVVEALPVPVKVTAPV